MKINSNKWYKVNIKEVKSIWWKQYSKDAFCVSVEVPELLAVTTCTFGLPKSLKKTKITKFSKVLGNIISSKYDDKLLRDPKGLASLINFDVTRTSYRAKLSKSSNPDYPVNVEEIERMQEGA